MIDDSHLARNMYRLLLAPHPEWEVEYAADLAPLSQWRIGPKSWHAVIVNTSLAAPDPDTLTQLFKTRPILRKIPKIFLVGPGQGALKDDLSHLPASVLIQKPFFPFDLITHINQIIRYDAQKTTTHKRR